MSGPAPPHAWKDPKKASAETFQTELETAVISGIGYRIRRDYKKMSAVLIHSEDDTGCDDLEEQLAETLRNFYSIDNIKRLLLGNGNPYLAISRVINELADTGYTGKGCLVILVFASQGQVHSKANTDPFRGPEDRLVFGADGNSRTRGFDWKTATFALSEEDCEILHIMDCCYAEDMEADAEVLAAATETISADGNKCFVKALITALRDFAPEPFSIYSLHQALVLNRTDLNLECIPFYQKRENRSSIVLGGWTGQVPAHKPDSPRILLTVHIEEDLNMRDIEDWKEWLEDLLPRSVMNMEIKLEGVWNAWSSVLLISLPISVWTQLDRCNTALHYVGQVTSHNRLLEQVAPKK
ncbi:hypothetical protein COCMIDRAFT_97663 [Bipolaris oryzae ATCC 44560]|uniref:Caspase family p20 domain-containing protein n=1 Tax=Bipolaris oryzae ATCC 44560 TaxID=930090 RepID=W6YZ35_COCMI|nr:uncharacterized protein COCMIDRAFT_97663 [Bipolaris oryzae ATCC 44560]EUC44637.1 hypothetical protein COCMIDRAFT_97663 [Bipolaris oryzae ATCC 44560]